MSASVTERTPDNYWPTLEDLQREELAVVVPDDASALTTEAAPGSRDAQEYAVRLTAQVAEIVDAAVSKEVPLSPLDAEHTAKRLRDVNRHVQDSLKQNPALTKHMEADVVSSLQEASGRGLDNWRLTDDERVQWQKLVAMESPKGIRKIMGPEWASRMSTMARDDAKESAQALFDRLKAQGTARLALDEQLASYTPQLAEAVATQEQPTPTHDAPTAGSAKQPTKAKNARRAERPVTTIGKPAEQEYVGRHRGTEAVSTEADDNYVGRHGIRKGASRRREGINDLVGLDAHGRAHYESGIDREGKSIKGRFMTKHELDTIEAHQDLIRDGLATRDEVLPNDAKQAEPLPVSADFPLTTDFAPEKSTAETATPEDTRDPEIMALAMRRLRESMSDDAWAAISKAGQDRVFAQLYTEAEREKWLDDNRPADFKEAAWNLLGLKAKERVYKRNLELQDREKQLSAIRPRDIADPVWRRMPLEVKEEVIDRMLQSAHEQMEAESGEDAEVQAQATRSRWGRVKNLLHKLSPFTLERNGEKANREVTFHKKRAAALSGVLVMSILAGVVAANQSEEAPRDNVASAEAFAHEAAAGAAAAAGQVAGELSDAAGLAKAEQAKAAAAKAAAEKAVQKTVAFKSGDTVWETAEMQLKAKGNKQPTVEQIDALKDHLLEINGLTEESAKLIPVGFKLKV